MTFILEELNMSARDVALNKIMQSSKRWHTRRIKAKEVRFLIDFVCEAKLKGATKRQVMDAFEDIPTILNCGVSEKDSFTLSEAFAVLMRPVSYNKLGAFRPPLVEILDGFYNK